MSADLAGWLGQTLVISVVTWALIYVTLRAIEYGADALWQVVRAARQRTRAAAQADAQATWRRELDAFVAKHPFDGDDSDMTDGNDASREVA